MCFKNIFSLTVLIVILYSCDKNGYMITANITGLQTGDKVLLSYIDNDKTIRVRDSAIALGSEVIIFEGQVNEPQIGYLKIVGVEGNIDLIIERGDIKVEVYRDSIFKSMVTGTNSNKDMNEYKRLLRSYNIEIEIARMRLLDSNILDEGESKQMFDKEIERIQQSIQKYNLEFVDQHPDSFVSLLLLDVLSKQVELSRDTLRSHFARLSPKLQSSTYAKRSLSELNKN